MAKRKTGRSKGGHNKGYWFRAGRGWFRTEGKSAIPLCDDQGNPIKNAEDKEGAKAAYSRYVLQIGQPSTKGNLTVHEVCQLYLDHARSNGSTETYRMRAGFLYDFGCGFPARFRESKTLPTAKDRLHPGYASKPVMELTPLDMERWVKAHPGWKNPRAALQAVRRAIMYCKESKQITANPISGLKVPKSGQRVAYINPKVENAIYKYANPALALFVKVCIKTGARPEIEFASLEPRHVIETPKGQCWQFPASESKGRKKPRTIYVSEDIAQLVRQAKHKGKVFRDKSGKPWTRRSLQSAFRLLRRRLARKGIELTKENLPLIPYTCRHTYAKRMLGGYWTEGKGVTLEVLAGLMGNTREICWNHYAQWSEQYTDPMWAAIAPLDHNSIRENSTVATLPVVG
jgi:integrase